MHYKDVGNYLIDEHKNRKTQQQIGLFGFTRNTSLSTDTVSRKTYL